MDVVLVTKNGMVKRTSVEEFRLQGRGGGGVAAMSLAEGDAIVGAAALDKASAVMVVTKKGTAIRFSVDDIRQMGRGARRAPARSVSRTATRSSGSSPCNLLAGLAGVVEGDPLHGAATYRALSARSLLGTL